MDYEKKYKESMAKMFTFLAKHDGFTISKDGEMYKELSDIFPELRESEDEKMRKGIIRNLEYLMDRAEGFVKDELKERIAWLEKQGEQKSNPCENGELREVEQKPAWSEEDKEMFEDTCRILSNSKECTTSNVRWLKSLRPQKQNITSKEFEDAIREIKTRIAQCNGFNRKHREEVFSLLDSLRPQNKWKPTEEQLYWLKQVIPNNSTSVSNEMEVLSELYRQLKALKEL